ncbi:YidB family protein [Streptomyces rimosus]|uniref:YidB family protein n=1 Tax=Streptomyces rimosus TaxID=1927 RepID=UPI001F21296C|nr:YidB family protein [Streptomyces rimosus]
MRKAKGSMDMTRSPDLGRLMGGLPGGGQGGAGGDLVGSLLGALGGTGPGGHGGPGHGIGPGGRGGIQAVLGTLLQGELGRQAHSWVGRGANEPVTPEQVEKALPGETLQRIADENGVSAQEAAEQLAHALPQAVDRLTPDGEIPQDPLFQDLVARRPRAVGRP